VQGSQRTQQPQQSVEHATGGGLSPDVQMLVQQVDRLETVATEAAARSADRGQGQLTRTCADIADAADLLKHSLVRQSLSTQQISQSVAGTIQNAVEQLQQYGTQPEIGPVLTQAQQVLAAISGGQPQSQMGQFGSNWGSTPQPSQFPGQQMGP
jgi:hypothetical protein